jgi:hypothetical protein
MTWSLLSDWQTKYHMIFNIWLTDRIWQYDMIFNIWLTDKIWHDLYYLTDRQNITWSLISDWQTEYDMICTIWLTQNMTWSLISDWQTKFDMIFTICLADKISHDLYYLTDRQNMTWSLISDWHKIWHDLYYLTDRQHIFSVISWQEDVTFSDYWLNPRPTVFKAHSLSVIFCIIYIWSK